MTFFGGFNNCNFDNRRLEHHSTMDTEADVDFHHVHARSCRVDMLGKINYDLMLLVQTKMKSVFKRYNLETVVKQVRGATKLVPQRGVFERVDVSDLTDDELNRFVKYCVMDCIACGESFVELRLDQEM